MNNLILKKTTSLLAIVTMLSISNASFAEGFYGSAMLGKNQQAKDSEPYGNNIAADSDFPAKFDSGEGESGLLGVGYTFNDKFRVEARIGVHNSDFNSREIGTNARAGEEYILNGSIDSKSLTIEGFYDFHTASSFTPYVKAGVGVSRNKYSARLGGAGVAAFDPFDGNTDGFYDAYADRKSTEFTWNVGFGASYSINDSIDLVGEYQYISLGDASTGQDSFTDGFRVDAAAHEALVGIRVKF